mgnify:CR=1 FL=1
MSTTHSDGARKVDGMKSEQLVGMRRNRWSTWIGMGGRHGPVYALLRNTTLLRLFLSFPVVGFTYFINLDVAFQNA